MTYEVSYFSDFFIACPNFPTTSNSPTSSYNPTDVTYGLNADELAKAFIDPLAMLLRIE